MTLHTHTYTQLKLNWYNRDEKKKWKRIDGLFILQLQWEKFYWNNIYWGELRNNDKCKWVIDLMIWKFFFFFFTLWKFNLSMENKMTFFGDEFLADDTMIHLGKQKKIEIYF